MKTHSPSTAQTNLLFTNLLDQLNPKNPLVQLEKKIAWEFFEKEFSPLYSHRGKPAKPIRLMVGLCILKHVENLSDEALVERWVQNPYYQAFCGETIFRWNFPCDPSDLTYFRKRIGKEGFEKIFAMSIAIHGEKAKEEVVHIDTTVHEKNVTFPTDDKLYLKIINRCTKLAKENGIKRRRCYAKEIKERKIALRFRQHPKNRSKVRKSVRRFKTISGILLRELTRKLPIEILKKEERNFELYARVLKQKRADKNKIYSLHEPHIYCIAKGKIHKKYEFGTKASITKTRDSNIIVGALAFEKNVYDGHTLDETLAQVEKISGLSVASAFLDRGYKGRSRVRKTNIFYPKPVLKNVSEKMKQYLQKQFCKRAGIEPVIGHLKSDHRMGRNFLKGFVGDQINLLMAAAAFNFRKWMRAIFFWIRFLFQLTRAEIAASC
jgi:IS5 family transposase